MRGFVRFLSYHNAVPVALSLVTLSFGAAFAASDTVRDGIYASETRTVTVDNTYIANKDLATYMPRAEIISVTEDAENYFVLYRLATIDVSDAVWQDVTKEVTMRVAKTFLGDSIDLGLHVTKELGQVVSAELERLRETQAIERRQVSTRTIATEYSGLVGQFLDPTVEELPGYVPVVVPPQDPIVQQSGSVAGSSSPGPGAPILSVIGDNPVRVPRGGAYRDLGVAVQDSPTSDLAVRAYVDGGPERTVGSIVLDTTYDRVWHIRYEATDGEGNTGSAERYILVGDAVLPGSVPEPVQEPATQIPPESPEGAPSDIPATSTDVLPPAAPETPTTTDPLP